METSWYNTSVGREWRILMQDMTNIYPGKELQYAEVFAISIGSFCEINPLVILGWIKDGKTPSIENLQRTLDVFSRIMRYRPGSASLIIQGTRNFKQEIRDLPYIEDKIKRLSEFLKKNPQLLDKLVKEYCDPPIQITARITGFDEKSRKYHVHFYNFKESNTAFMRERINQYNQIKNLLQNITVKNEIANKIKNKNFIINLDFENSITEM